ncbi:MAG TPA: Ig-like domain-containing protein, partial [Thermoanaerobaculia bacterium]|nr:Ig-like domain-containing protein [Thermoanaerobaculia bacterium]
RDALNRGFHLGPTADHDSHCNNFGQGLPTRTVYLIPNVATPILTRANLLLAHKQRHFFATEDANAQLVFASSDGHVMGDIFGTGASINLRAAAYDPNGDGIQTFELWRGQIGGGVQSAPYKTFSGSSFSTSESPGTGTWYYFVHAVQADGHDLWSSPMWITFGSGGGDTTKPTTAITAPAAGATLSGTTTVTAAASDNVGVTKVELYVDGGLLATDTTSPYSWSWNTATAANGAHALSTKAYDAAGNVGSSATVSVTVSNGTDVSGWKITQANATLNYVIPAGTVIPANGYLVVARSASKAAFQSFWGVTLVSNVVYVNSADTMPQINGSETYTLYNAAGTKVDGATYPMGSSAGQSLRRKDPCNSPGTSTSWTIGATTTANPGSGAGAGCAKGPVINEFSDASGTGNYVYEFVELHNDR